MKTCPNCNGKALQQVETPAKIVLDTCPNCKGTWFDENDLAELVGNPTMVEKNIRQALSNSVKSDKLSPVSGKAMLEIPYRGKTPIYYCEESRGLWVEQGEMRSVIS